MERANIETDAAIFYSVGSNDYQVLDTSRNVIALDNSTELVSEKEFAVYKSAEKATRKDGWSFLQTSYRDSGAAAGTLSP